MIIISQNGNFITNSMNLRIMPKYNSENVLWGYEILCENLSSLGLYSTEKRCQEILEYIAKNCETQRIYKMPKE